MLSTKQSKHLFEIDFNMLQEPQHDTATNNCKTIFYY